MKRLIASLFGFFFVAVSAYSQLPINPPPPPPELTVEILKSLPLSGLTFFSTLRGILNRTQAGSPSAAPHSVVASSMYSSARFLPRIDSTQTQDQLTSNTVKDVEPTTLTTTVAGTVYNINVAPQVSSDTSFVNVAHTRDNWGFLWEQTFPLPRAAEGWTGTGYLVNGDPLLSKAGTNAPIAPGRVYCVGITHTGTAFVAPSGVGVWHSDDGGKTWSFPARVAENLQAGQFIDKPSIAVSSYTPSVGEVFVAYTLFRDSGGHQEIHVARSTDGGMTFPQDTCVSRDVNGNCLALFYSMSQVMVDARNGAIYAIYVDFGFNRIMATASTNSGVTWSTPSVVANTPVIQPSRLLNGTRTGTVPMARYNIPQARINIVWHAYEADGIHSDIFLATKAAGVPWSIVPLSDRGVSSGQDQFQPALDNEGAGNILIAYYSRAEDPSNRLYRAFSIMVSADGLTTVRSEEPALNNFLQPPTFQSDANATNEATVGFIGDYHDVFMTDLRFQNAWVGRPGSSFEIFNYGLWY